MRMRAGRRMLAALALIGVSACSSGGRAPATMPAAQPAAAVRAGSATLTFTIPPRVPAAFLHRKKPAYVSSSSALLNVVATGSQGSITTPAIALGAYCQSETGGEVCSVPVPAPIGSDTLTVKLEDSGAHVLSIATGVTVTVVEGTANAATPVVMNPVPTAIAVTFAGAAADSTGAVPVAIAAADYDGNTISGQGSYVDASGNALALTLTAQTTSTGSFSTSASCASTGTTFSAWTITSTLYFCPSGQATLGSIYALALGSIQTTFAARRTGQSTAGALPAESNGAAGSAGSIVSIAGSDQPSSLVAIGTNQHQVLVGFYNTGNIWSVCPNYDGATYAALGFSPDGTDLFGAKGGFATLDEFDDLTACTLTGSELGTGSDVTQLTPDPRVGSTTVYAVNTDDGTSEGLRSINAATQAVAAGGVPNCGVSPSYPHSIAVGPNDVLYVGCDNATSIDSQPLSSFGTTHTTIAIPSTGRYTASYVVANVDVAFAITTGTGKPVLVYEIVNGAAQLIFTFPAASDSYIAGSAAVANDDRLYLTLYNSSTTSYRVVSFDPSTNTLTDPAVVVSSVLSTSDPLLVALGHSGTIVVGGTRPDGYLGFAYWPN